MSSELENRKETIETLNGIMNSMEKVILENQIALDSVIKQCFDHTNVTCHNPDTVLLEQDQLVNEFNRISDIIRDEMKNCESMKELIEERKEIELRLHNTQMIIEILSDYRVIYDQLINVEQQLHNNKIEEAIKMLKDNEQRLSHLKEKSQKNDQLIFILNRVNNRKLFFVKGIASKLLSQRIMISSTTISIMTSCNDSQSISLQTLLLLIQQLDSFDMLMNPIFAKLKDFCERIFSTNIICNESQHDQMNAVFTDFSIQETSSIIIEKGLYPQSLILLLRYLNSSLLEFNEEMKEQFVDQVYFPLQEEIVNWIKSTIPTDIHEINKWKNQLQEISRIEQCALSCHFIGEEQKVIEPLIESIEIEWIKKRQNYYFSQIRSFLIENPENISRIDYDCQSTTEKEYCFDLNSYGDKDKNSGYYELFTTDSPPFSTKSESYFQNQLTIGICKIHSNLLSILHLLHAFIQEGVSFDVVISERFLSVLKEFVHLILIKIMNYSNETDLNENCCYFNDLSVLLYHLFIISYKYHEQLQGVNLNVFVCVEEIPFIRDIQHRFYLRILTIMNNELPSLIMDCLEGSEEKKIQAAHSILDIRKTIDNLTGEAHSAILQEFCKKTEILSGIEMNNNGELFSLIRQIIQI